MAAFRVSSVIDGDTFEVSKQQALTLRQELGAPFIFLTNGELIYFWDYRTMMPASSIRSSPAAI